MLDQEILALERIGALTWPAREMEWLDGWLLSMDRGLTRRANSVLPLGWDDGAEISDRIEAVERRYRDRGLPPCFKMTPAARPDGLEDLLDRRGYRPGGHSLVLTAPLDGPGGPPDPSIVLSPELAADWIDCTWPEKGADDRWVGIMRRIAGERAFAFAHRDGRPAGGALAVVEQGWCCITAVHTRPAVRGRGVGRSVMAALLSWAGERASAAFIQVEADNEPALRLYASAGFRAVYPYHYRMAAA